VTTNTREAKTVAKEKEHRDSLKQYLTEIRRHELLTHDQQLALAIRFKENGDEEAKKMLVHCNLRLVVKIAKESQRIWMDNLLDLIQEGNLGLMRAVIKFDSLRNVKFSYYASFWINAYILKFMLENWRLVKIGTSEIQRKLFWQLSKEKKKLEKEGIDPTVEIIAERLGVGKKDVIDMSNRLSQYDLSLSKPVHETGSATLEDRMPFYFNTEEVVAEKDQKVKRKKMLNRFRKTLSERELYIFNNRMCAEEPLTLEEIGDRFDITKQRVAQIQKAIKNKLVDFNDGDKDVLKIKIELINVTQTEIESVTSIGTKKQEGALFHFGFKGGGERFTAEEIAQKTGTTRNYVASFLSVVRREIRKLRGEKESLTQN
jgi:RNA polymerase sigma-32 factor